MDADNNNYIGAERRSGAVDRRSAEDRRLIVRFEDVLGRRSGVERRLGFDVDSLLE
jgi:hypothetical protein